MVVQVFSQTAAARLAPIAGHAGLLFFGLRGGGADPAKGEDEADPDRGEHEEGVVPIIACSANINEQDLAAQSP